MYSSCEYVDMILTFARCGNNACEASLGVEKRVRCSQFEEEVTVAPRNVGTVEHEEAVLNVFEEDGTRSIRTVSREMGLSKSSVQRVLADNRRHPYHYTRVQHLLPEDYPIRRDFYLWLINQNDASHFLSRILFSDESLFCR
jgi:hypothetical protein